MEDVTQAEVELLRIQVNGVVNNDDAMYPAFKPYRQKGNDYTYFTPRLLTRASRTDGYAGHFVATALAATAEGTEVLRFARGIARESPGALERFVRPLLKGCVPDNACLAPKYEREYGRLAPTRVTYVSKLMRQQTEAIAQLCRNLADCSHYHRIRYLVLGLLAWLMAYLLRTAAVNADGPPLLLFDFVGVRDRPIRSQSQTCYARLRETVRRAYLDLADAGSLAPIRSRKDFSNERVGQRATIFVFWKNILATLRCAWAMPSPGPPAYRKNTLSFNPIRSVRLC